MKKILLLAVSLLYINLSSQACDKGCTMGGSYLGILPQFHKNFAGLRYSTRSYTITTTHTHIHEGMPITHTDIIDEQFNTMELWGRYVPVKDVQIFAFVPYAFNQQSTTRGNTNYSGLGDITLLANYSLLNTGDSANHVLKHTLQLGGGVKFATGSHTQNKSDEGYAANLQPGTGSTDYLVNVIYTVRYGKAGLNNDFTYRFNTENEEGYTFGDRVSASTNLFYWLNIENMTLLPSAGLYYEHAKADEFEHVDEGQKGGDAYYTNLGLNMYLQKVAVGGTLQIPLSSTDDHHVTKGNNRAMVSLSYLF